MLDGKVARFIPFVFAGSSRKVEGGDEFCEASPGGIKITDHVPARSPVRELKPAADRNVPVCVKERSMENIEWNDGMSIKVKELDDPRKDLIEYLNRFVEVVKEGQISKELIDSLADMIDRMRFLFKREEMTLSRYKYPELEFHQEMHKRLIKRIIRFRRWIAEDPEDLSHANLDSFLESVRDHLVREDLEYAPFLRLKIYLIAVAQR